MTYNTAITDRLYTILLYGYMWWRANPACWTILAAMLGVITNMGVNMCTNIAYAGGETDIFVNFFKAYPCAGISVRNLPLHELHQHGTHMAGWAASNLPNKGYYYLPLTQTHTKNEGDALLFNPITNHKVVIQCKAGIQTQASYIITQDWLQKYAVNIQLLSYGVYEQSWHDYMVKEVFKNLSGVRKSNNIHLDCVSVLMNTNYNLTQSKALDLEQAIYINSIVVGNDAYNEFMTSYYNVNAKVQQEEIIHMPLLTDAQVIAEFTRGLRMFVGEQQVALLSEM